MLERLCRGSPLGDVPCRYCIPSSQALIDQETRAAPEQRKEEGCRGIGWGESSDHFEDQFLLSREWLQRVRVLRLEAPAGSGYLTDHQTSPLFPLFSSSAFPMSSEDRPSIFIRRLATLSECPGCVSFIRTNSTNLATVGASNRVFNGCLREKTLFTSETIRAASNESPPSAEKSS